MCIMYALTILLYRLVELSEHIEVLEAAIEFKNDAIASRELHSSQILSSENMTDTLCQKLQQMSTAQVRALLVGYVGKVVDLRVAGGRRERERMKMAAECTEKQQTIVNLQRSLKQTRLEVERRLLSQEKVRQYHTCRNMLTAQRLYVYVDKYMYMYVPESYVRHMGYCIVLASLS